MNFDQLNAEPKLLVSDSLKDVLPEDQLDQVDEMFISIAVVVDPRDASLTGNLSAVEFGENPKIDVKTSLKEAFRFIGHVVSNKHTGKEVNSLILLLGEDSISIPGPFKMSGVKIVDVDSSSKLCILAIDLIKDTP